MKEHLQRIKTIKKRLSQLGPVLPGSLSEQWNVCGKPGCRCKAPDKPQKHGPYYQLSFTVDGKSSSMFVKKEDLKVVRECMKRYTQLRRLNTDLLQAYLDYARKGGLHQK
jgi:hypothetical protein